MEQRNIVEQNRSYFILLPEIWEHIFSYLPPQDFISVINSCPEWSQLLTLRKPNALFSMALPSLLNYIPRNTILTCRQVSRNFKTGVDSVLSNHFSNPDKIFAYNRYKSQPRSTQVIERLRFRFTFVNGWHFLKSFRDSYDSNPFLTRSISILVGRTHYDSPSIKQIVSLHGHHLLRLHLQCNYPQANHFNVNGEAILDEIAALLHLVPNLKILKITTTPFIWPSTSERLILPHFPKLNDLEFLEVDDNNHFFIVKPIVLRYGNQIRILSCSGRLLESGNFDTFLPNLRKLCVNFVSSTSLECLANCKNGRWPLEILKLRIFPENVEALEVLEAVGAFSGSLIELELVCNPNLNEVGEFYGKQIKNERENKCEKIAKRLSVFTSLKVITTEWKIMKSKWFIEFILGKCPNLQELCLFCEYEGVLDEVEEFKKVLREVDSMEKVEWWIWERGRFILRKTTMFSKNSGLENLTQLEDVTTGDLELNKADNFYEITEASSDLEIEGKTSNLFICCYQ